MSESHFNAIVILDAVPKGELNTSRRLKDNLVDMTYDVADGLNIRYVRIETFHDLESGITKILDGIINNGLKPWLHLDGHGWADESGFKLAGGAACSWDQFKEIITPLNLALGLNLIVVLATCFGGSFTRAIQTMDRAPVLGLIGPVREVQIGEVDRAFPAFYKTFFESKSLKEALKVLDSSTPTVQYYRTSAEHHFYAVWAGYKKNYCTKKEIENRARRLYRMAKKDKLSPLPSVGHFKRELRSQEGRLFEKYRDNYFMYDIDDFNRERFPVTYKEAESYTK